MGGTGASVSMRRSLVALPEMNVEYRSLTEFRRYPKGGRVG